MIGLLAALIGPLLVLATYSFAVQHTVGDPTYIKKTLEDVNIYQALGNQIKDQAGAENSVQDKVASKALKKATQPEVVQGVVEKGIDSIFGFLNGQTKIDDVRIDISPVTDVLHQQMLVETKKQIVSLPTCTSIPASADPLQARCVPPGVNENALAKQVVDKAFAKQDLLGSKTLSITELQKMTANNNENHGKNSQKPQQDIEQLKQNLNRAALIYRLSKWLAPVATVLAILCGAGVVFLSTSKLRGLRRVGWLLLTNGVIITISSVLFNLAAQTVMPATISGGSNIGDVAPNMAKVIVHDISVYARAAGILMFTVGLIACVVTTIYLKKQTKTEQTDQPEITGGQKGSKAESNSVQ